VDVWDALLSDRPYRKVWTEEEARNYIQSEAGSHFGPRIVEKFFEMIKELESSLTTHRKQFEEDDLLFEVKKVVHRGYSSGGGVGSS
jgi:response regulator RpfG family c-di-GMP phosphodiesterase